VLAAYRLFVGRYPQAEKPAAQKQRVLSHTLLFFPPLTDNANYSLLFKLNTKVSFAYFN